MEHQELVKKILPLFQAARIYHRHEVVGLSHVPPQGRTLIVVNHSLATYDIILLMTAIYTELNRMPRPLIDSAFFRVPYLGEVVTLFGSVKGSQDSASALLEADEVVTVAPGGMREALRPSTERYQIRWEKRFGFIKLAMRTRSPIVLAACPKADDLYDVYPSAITSWVYKNLRFPVFFARGIGLTPFPRPVKLVHHLSEPYLPPELTGDKDTDDQMVRDCHALLVKRMHELISDAIQHRS